ncbi:hypothetical protein [Asticcacaulis sp.]|uniref:hypothetical protein n=1 Tax=Asticcacaulis sp. TaxID=1872648 RepID=UPI00260BA2B6|nr:hypothetical protein [Asticcacaulis sp.]
MEITLNHGVEYEIVDPVSVEDLVKSIEAHARLLRATSDLISELVPGLQIETKKVSVVYLSQQSPLKEAFAVGLYLTYQKELEKEVPELIEALTNTKIPDRYDTLVTVLVMLVAIYGISKALDTLFPGKSKANIEETKESLTSQAAKIIGVTSKRLIVALEVLFKGRSERVLVNSSQKMFAPTRNQTFASIRDARGQVLVGQDATRDAQAASGLPYEIEDNDDAETSSQFHQGVRIILHAMDKDRKKSGWAGHCPDLFDERIPMHLEKTLKPEKIFGHDEIKGDILLTSEEDAEGKMVAKEFLLIQAYM